MLNDNHIMSTLEDKSHDNTEATIDEGHSPIVSIMEARLGMKNEVILESYAAIRDSIAILTELYNVIDK